MNHDVSCDSWKSTFDTYRLLSFANSTEPVLLSHGTLLALAHILGQQKITDMGQSKLSHPKLLTVPFSSFWISWHASGLCFKVCIRRIVWRFIVRLKCKTFPSFHYKTSYYIPKKNVIFLNCSFNYYLFINFY